MSRSARGYAMILGLLIVVVIGMILYFGFRGWSPSGPSQPGYIEHTIAARDRAREVAALAQAASLGRSLRMYADQNGGRFPPTLAEGAASGYISADLITIPGTNKKLQYIPGQTASSPSDNVLAYQEPEGPGPFVAIRADGRAELLPADALREAVKQTREGLP